ncbi:chromosome segregation protein SMC [Candidatus Protochlamydia amoebophila]|uniref:chromosome segregation protein SMC n=1 Tax=Candidatus Protochlamydia amoebophila TaxID=362787 RepID=UPI00057CFC42|nr:chromosome segregation protein SMC [Candidatus Protochlamydia amoebophila]
MRLKKLMAVGFKSFADKTVLNFDRGITCIVGPNGCGKSNIADAFRWVLGEQSAKSMRGHKMPDIIFAGTNHRRPLNFAEVSLTLTEVQGTLPIDYEEITLTRRLHRSGESEYFINGNLVRLKDIQGLFLDSGVGRNAFSIFEQGKLDQVINYTSLERRHIFEEAAGILRFLQRKREALKRLEQADLNFSRVNDIHLEVGKQIEALQVQAKKALQFKESKTQLESFEKTSYLLRWEGIEKKKTDVNQKQEKQKERLTIQQQSLIQSQQESQKIKLHIQTSDKSLKSKQEELFKIRNEKELLIQENQNEKQRLEEIQLKERKIKRELEELAIARQARQKTLQEIQSNQNKLEAEFKDIESKLSHQQDKVKFKEREVTKLRQELQLKQQTHIKHLQEESQLLSEIKQTEVRLENYEDKKETLKIRLKQLSEDSQTITQLIQEKKKQLQQISGLVDSHKDRLEQYEEELKTIARDQETKQKEIEIHKRKLIELIARQKVLLRMREEHEGFSSGSKRLLLESQNSQSLFFKKLRPLYEFIALEPEIAEASSVILKAYSQTLVVETAADFEQILQFAKRENLQDYSLICLEMLQERKNFSKNPQPFLIKKDVHPVIMHFLQNVILFNSYEEVSKNLNEPGLEGWSPDQNFIDHKNVFFKVKISENQVFLRETELKSLGIELEEKENQVLKIEQTLSRMVQQKTSLQAERAELDKMLRRDEMKLVEINFGLQRILGDLEKSKIEQTQILIDEKIIFEQIEEQTYLLKQIQNKHFILRQDIIQRQQEVDLLQSELEKQESALRIQLQDHKEKGELYRQLSENKQHLLHQHHLLESKEQDHDYQVQRFTEEIGESQELQYHLKQKQSLNQLSLTSLEERLQFIHNEYSDREKECEVLKKSLEDLEQKTLSQYAETKKMETDLAQIQILEAHLNSSAQALQTELRERYDLAMAELVVLTLPIDLSLEQVEKQIRTIKQTIQLAGDVNLSAIEDLEKHQLRFNFLNQQLQDMHESKKELLQIISQLDEESRKLFKETFEEIRHNFKKNFQILFNGGEADLHFTETDDILEAGIEISAKPPGKQMRSISLLSGGEKCLTAVALLFAIFEVKPAPFCILDEIDAPLDDSNVERFVNVVKHFADRCQFLIITHNKGTMAIGDVLFGVSMEEKGVSKLLSLEFTHQTPEVTLVD